MDDTLSMVTNNILRPIRSHKVRHH